MRVGASTCRKSWLVRWVVDEAGFHPLNTAIPNLNPGYCKTGRFKPPTIHEQVTNARICAPTSVHSWKIRGRFEKTTLPGFWAGCEILNLELKSDCPNSYDIIPPPLKGTFCLGRAISVPGRVDIPAKLISFRARSSIARWRTTKVKETKWLSFP